MSDTIEKSWSTLELKSVDSEKRIITGVASTPNTDRDGDIVDPKGAKFSLPFPLLSQHNHDTPIGQVTSAKATEAGIEITAQIAIGSDLGYVEKAWKQIKSGLVRGLSIGFRPLKAEPIKSGGRRFTSYEIFELSAVTVPANAFAGITAIKSFDANPASDDHLIESVDLAESTAIEAAAEIETPKVKTNKSQKIQGTKMNISSKIEAAEEGLNAVRDQLSAAVESSDDSQDSIDLRKGLQSEFDRKEENLNLLKNHEQSVASVAAPVEVKAQSSIKSAPAVVRAQSLKGGDADLLVKSAAATLEAHIRRVSVEQILEERYSNDDRVKAVVGITKAAQNPAMTNVAGWAQELTRESFGAFMDLVKPESVLPRLGLSSYDFAGTTKINIPRRIKDPKNLEAAFRAEGAPIRVGASQVGSVSLTPKNLGVIGTFTNELFEASTPNILSLIQGWMVEDTAVAIDTAFLGVAAGSATVPTGIANGLATVVAGVLTPVTPLTNPNVHASPAAPATGVTHATMQKDIRACFTAMANSGLGRRPVWIMHPSRAIGLELSLTAAGTPAFPSLSSGVLMGAPVVTSTTVPADGIYLVDAAELAFAGGAPRFLGTEVASIHEEYDAPLPLVDGAGTAAQPVRSLYQTNSSAIRMIMQLDWTVLRPGAVQLITNVTY